jgi:hypothetical protein
MLILKRRYDEQLEEDASERLWRLFGKMIHKVLEEYGELTEQKVTKEIDGITISGVMDVIRETQVDDYKVTSVWSYLFDPEGKQEWIEQLNIYKWLLQGIFDIKELKIHLILRDWMKSKAEVDKEYPQIPFITIDLPILNNIEEIIRQRVRKYLDNREKSDIDIDMCSEEERWRRPTTFAIMKKGRQRAIKLCDTKEEAEEMLKNDKSYYIEVRPGMDIRCERYCLVRDICKQTRKEEL